MIRRMRPLLVRLLRRHLSDTTLLAFDAGDLPPAARRRAVRHMGQCEQCRARLAAFQSELEKLTVLFDQASAVPAGLGRNWPALLKAIRERQGNAPAAVLPFTALAPYLGQLATKPDAQSQPGQSPAEVLETLLGSRAATGLLERRPAARPSASGSPGR